MLRWEYLVNRYYEQSDDSTQAELDALGDEGWELVAVSTGDRSRCMYFKRPLVAEEVAFDAEAQQG